ncbi:hypothetical protein Agabi119p4_9209 [Agaricus bisporus var. burnettii]|uniref:Reverse transcriptase Ty1/copia-type domain-containing protein n=1 Tax=Agaricus bisporus var. burnettii TaxID=192524 RepID=A0A8H7C557_AGABI|nr:hypothetical protein Agabi119p4_9209 [Agaricus bisporus var. burnettii]
MLLDSWANSHAAHHTITVLTRLPVTPPTAGAPLEPPHVPRRTGRVRKPPGQWWKLKQPDLAGNDSDSDDEAALLADSEFCEVEFAGAVSGADPRSYRLAMKSPDSDCWTEACNTEIFNLEANGTWELMELPPGKKVVNSGWVFKVKRLADGSIERYRARLVAKGYSQRPGFDFTEVFAPTFRCRATRGERNLEVREGLFTTKFNYAAVLRQATRIKQCGPPTFTTTEVMQAAISK